MQYVDYYGYGLHQLVYISRMARPLSRGEIDHIVIQASLANNAKAISGALLVYNDTFVQVLEGDHATLHPVFRKIEADCRHTNVVLKAVEPIARRQFGRWGMRLGKAPAAGAADLTCLSGDQLVTLLALSAGKPRAKAA